MLFAFTIVGTSSKITVQLILNLTLHIHKAKYFRVSAISRVVLNNTLLRYSRYVKVQTCNIIFYFYSTFLSSFISFSNRHEILLVCRERERESAPSNKKTTSPRVLPSCLLAGDKGSGLPTQARPGSKGDSMVPTPRLCRRPPFLSAFPVTSPSFSRWPQSIPSRLFLT